MKSLKNWDNKTWLSSKEYISSFHKFLKYKINFDKNIKILDIGCGRANIISYLQRKYKFYNKPIGIDIVKNKKIKKNIIFIKKDAIKYCKNDKNFFDLIIIKQTLHFFSKKEIRILLNLSKKKLNKKGRLLIFSLKTKKNEIPCFKKMKKKLNSSLKRDEKILKLVKSKLKNYNQNFFNFKVNISKNKYLKMIKNKYISILLEFSHQDIKIGIQELSLKYKKEINFLDSLSCISFKK